MSVRKLLKKYTGIKSEAETAVLATPQWKKDHLQRLLGRKPTQREVLNYRRTVAKNPIPSDKVQEKLAKRQRRVREEREAAVRKEKEAAAEAGTGEGSQGGATS